MPVKSGKLTQREKAFSRNMAITGDKVLSAQRAGYSSPQVRGYETAARPAVQEEIAREQTRILFGQALPIAMQTLISIMLDPRAPAGARVQAVKITLDRTLGDNAERGGKEPHEMSADELNKAINDLESVAAARAIPVQLPDVLG